MIYVEIVNNEVGITHLKPFDAKDGLGKTREELEQTGLVLESEPVPEKIEGKDAILKYNPTTKSLYYEYVDSVPTPKTDMELALERIASLEKSNAELTTLIATMTTPTV
ncbi:hypothetical protein [Clostridium sulfidigenes]|uniref:hypothetical protein n=1 Tax=Clostridium sulfidigenes TaxID=318464 RepID=UPI000691E8C5|nr:hypothetical protein [Clostridium sulfidigenes]